MPESRDPNRDACIRVGDFATDTRIFSRELVRLRLCNSISYRRARCFICITVHNDAQLSHATFTHSVYRVLQFVDLLDAAGSIQRLIAAELLEWFLTWGDLHKLPSRVSLHSSRSMHVGLCDCDISPGDL